MMLRRKILLAFFFLAGGMAAAQPLSLDRCREAAREAGHLETLYQMVEMDRETRLRLARSPFQPTVLAYGSMSYQSDSPNPASLTDFPFVLHAVPKFQHHSGVLLNQVIYSGGQRKLTAGLSDIEHGTERLELDRQAIDLDASVDELYLGIILDRKRSDILQSQLNAVRIKLEDARKAFESGFSYKNIVLALEAQLSQIEAQLAGNQAETAGMEAMLSTLTGLEIDAATELILPYGAVHTFELPDPGFARLELESERIRLQQKLNRAQALPKLSAFATVGYGQWPLNFFDRDPAAFGVVGLNLVIPISTWREVGEQGRLLDNAARKLELRRDTMQRQKTAALQQYDAEIEKYDALLSTSLLAVGKYEEMCAELDSLSAQGLAPTSEYLTALEQLSAARMDSELYSILKLQSQLQRQRYISSL